MYLRFSTKQLDPESSRNTGILVAAHTLRDEGDISVQQHNELRKVLLWFNENLQVPKLLNDVEHRRAISWFKPEAKEAINKMWQLVDVLKSHGIETEVLKTKDPGVVVYEDEWQLIAKPRKGQKVPW